MSGVPLPDHHFTPRRPELQAAARWSQALCRQPDADLRKWDTPQGRKAADLAFFACVGCKVQDLCLGNAAFNQPDNRTPTGVHAGMYGAKLGEACERVRAGENPTDVLGDDQ